MAYEFKPGEHRTRDGQKAVVTEIVEGQDYPLFGRVETEPGIWAAATWTDAGKYRRDCENHDLNLMPPEPKTEVRYVNMYRDVSGNIWVERPYNSRTIADDWGKHNSSSKRIACVKITITEGQFDD